MADVHLITNVVGTAAGICSMTSFVPQIVKIVRERDASSVSLRMYMVTVTGFTLWIIFGVLQASWPIWASNVVCLALTATILILRLKYGAAKKEGLGARSTAATAGG